ncbi:MAG: abortive infection system antitoxin AbiGi family protein [Candidatus Cloacimonadales bacterium]|nr:abortive infection system antitoxin AbiGi family protein [Candidatus Cloacimonadales bacterium]
MSSNLSSNTLFHYTDFECLMKILKEGFKPNYSLENFEFLFEKESNIKNNHIIPMVCFCDIPISSTKEHIFNYDKYAIGLSRKWGEDNGLNPVMYISRNSKVINNFRYAYSNYNDIVIEIEKEKEDLYNKLKKSKFEDLTEDARNEISKKIGKKITNQNFEEEIKNYTMKCFCEDYLLNHTKPLSIIRK